jgi:hypothetical protein
MSAITRRWQSTVDKTFGQELISTPLRPDALTAALRPLLNASIEGEFLLARLAPSDHAGVCAALRAVYALKPNIRISLLIDLVTLQRLEYGLPNTDSTGLVLDGVCLATPASALIVESIEAVRFDDSFTVAASRNLRIDAAMRAMLALTSDLGLGTFASTSFEAQSLSSHTPMFDYVARSVKTPIVVRAGADAASRFAAKTSEHHR